MTFCWAFCLAACCSIWGNPKTPLSPARAFQAPIPAAPYAIQRIDSLPSVYVLHVTRHDSLFKLVSAKVNHPAGVHIQVGKSYPLRLNKGLGFQSCLVGYFNDISLDWESGHDLYAADNLEGLYLQ